MCHIAGYHFFENESDFRPSQDIPPGRKMRIYP